VNNLHYKVLDNSSETKQVINRQPLTKQRDKKWIVVRHDDQIHDLISRARLQVAKRTSDVVVLTTASYEHLTTITNTHSAYQTQTALVTCSTAKAGNIQLRETTI